VRRPRRAFRLAALPALLVLLGACSLGLALVALTSLQSYRSPYVFADLRAGPATERLVDRVVVVVVDGLRRDTADRLPELEALRAGGAELTSLAGQPSYSRAGYATLGTGAWPEVHGFLLNSATGRSQVDSLFAETRAHGLKPALVGYSWWTDLFGDDLPSRWINPGSDDPAKDQFGNLNNSGPVDREVIFADEAIRILRKHDPDLLYVHFQDTDQKAHDFGIGPEYLRQAHVIGEQIERLVRELDLSRDVLILTADHGHIARGGHGGWEPEAVQTPLILAGRAIRLGGYGTVDQVDIPATAAALLGVPFPTSAQGRVLWEVLDVPVEARAAKELALGQTQAAFARGYAGVVGGQAPDITSLDEAARLLAAGDFQAAFDHAAAARAELQRGVSAARDARIARERLIRLPVLLLVLALPVLFWRRPAADAAIGLAAAAAFFLTFHGLFLAQGNSYSLSTIYSTGSFILEVAIDAAAAALAGSLVIGLLLRRSPPAEHTTRALTALSIVAWTVLVQGSACFVWSGATVTWTVPDMRVSFWLFLCLFQLAGIGLLSPVVPMIATWVARPRLQMN
jgi:hypothetical protein